jgi:hypothetical protein
MARNLNHSDDEIDSDATIPRYPLHSNPHVVLVSPLHTPSRRRRITCTPAAQARWGSQQLSSSLLLFCDKTLVSFLPWQVQLIFLHRGVVYNCLLPRPNYALHYLSWASNQIACEMCNGTKKRSGHKLNIAHLSILLTLKQTSCLQYSWW